MVVKAMIVAKKDLRLVTAGGSGLAQPVLLGLLLIFLFSLAVPVGGKVEAQTAAAVFWICSCFSIVLLFNGLFGLEEGDDAKLGLTLAPLPLQAVWLGKVFAGFILLLITQAVFLPAVVVFLGQNSISSPGLGCAGLIVADIGLVVLGGVLGALAQGQASREALLSVIIFPLLLPVLLAGIRVGSEAISGLNQDVSGWLLLAGAFDALFAGVAVILFPTVYRSQ